MTGRPLRIAVVAGEESGDLLGADIVRALQRTGREVELVGVGGHHLQALGLKSLFPSGDIALMGISAVVRDLPRLMRRISQSAHAVAAARPDCLITIDSPDFSLRVARKVRALSPQIPIVHYVCPSVWAWRPGRALAMKPYVDEILCLLPFEPAELARLGGPAGTFVGHRLSFDPGILSAAAAQERPRDLHPEREKTLLLLPGSRRGEIGKLLDPFAQTVSILSERGHRLKLLLPTVPHVAESVRALVSAWPQQPEIIVERDEKYRAFGVADAALIASGTVSLELALAGVPMVSTYKLDPLMRLVQSRIKVWSALLPNLIADRPLVFEVYNEYVRPPYLARHLEVLFSDASHRTWLREGFADVRRRMATDRSSGDLAADVVMRRIGSRE